MHRYIPQNLSLDLQPSILVHWWEDFQPLEAFFTLRSPFELYPLLLQISDGMCNLGKSLNESPVVSCKSHKISYIRHISWSRPIHNGFNLLRVHWYTLFWDNVTQILYSVSVEVTLAQFCIQLMLPVEDTVHKAHKCSWCICETKWYHYKLIMSIPCPEGCLMNVFILDSHLMVTRPQVNIGKYLCSSHLIKEVINSR